jgi:hypothetical protein
MRTHYDNLKVPENASQEMIKKAFRALSKKHHPDQNPGNADSQRIMQILNDAYEVLGNENRRAAYDRSLRERRAPPMPSYSNPNAASARPSHAYPPPYHRPQAARARSAARSARSFRRDFSQGPQEGFGTMVFRRFGQVLVMFILVSLYLGSRATLPEAGSRPQTPSMRSTIVSPFRGWQGGTVVTLNNGQTWRQIGSRAILSKRPNPGVLLYYQNNQWYMQVDGVAESMAVERVDALRSPFIRREIGEPIRRGH